MTKRIENKFEQVRAQKRAALVTFVMGGDPDFETSFQIIAHLPKAGADLIEIGMPFTDPMADGPAIQAANLRSLANGTKTADIFRMAADFRARHPEVPLVLMGYANPIERMGIPTFIAESKAAGVDGAIVVDYPPEECEDFAATLRAHNMDLIFLLAPTSTDTRIEQVARVASGYVYYVSLKGITGAGHLDTDAVEAMLPRIRKHVHIPVGVGFGIRDAATAQTVGRVADAVVIGSRIIQLLEAAPKGNEIASVREFIHGIRVALDA